MSLPVLSRGFNEGFRRDVARNDLSRIAGQAAEQVAVHDYATRAATEILQAVGAADIPNRQTLFELANSLTSEPQPDHNVSLGALARQLAGATSDEAPRGVSRADIARDMLRPLHPDKATQDTDITIKNVETFQAVTEAQQYDDHVTTQGLYAGTVAETALAAGDSSVGMLERTRYKAWLALQAGKGKFGSREEVDVWKEQELSAIPYKTRAGVMASSVDVLSGLIDKIGDFTIPQDCYEALSRGIEVSKRAFSGIMDGTLTADELAKADLRAFDDYMGKAVALLQGLQNIHSILGSTNSSYYPPFISKFGERLRQAARALEGYKLHPEDIRNLGAAVLAAATIEGGSQDSILGNIGIPPNLNSDKIIPNERKYENWDDNFIIRPKF